MRKLLPLAVLALALVASGCTSKKLSVNAREMKAASSLNISPAELAGLKDKPLYKMTPAEVDRYLQFLHASEPSLRKRVVTIGRKNLNQPYEMYLLGEYPYEVYDPQPLYCLEKSDCVVFSEHTYAMALSPDWKTFFDTLQKIRYKDGEIGVATRNHYMESDWNVNNGWLVQDVTNELAGPAAAPYKQKVDRAKFLKNRYKLDRDIPVQNLEDTYVPLSEMQRVMPLLQDGDFVNVMVGHSADGVWSTHTGLIVKGEDGTAHFLHSTPPRVREEPLQAYIDRSLARAEKAARKGEKKAALYGFKFLRLREDADKAIAQAE